MRRTHAELDAGCDYSNYSLYSLHAHLKVGQRGGRWVNCFCFHPICRKKRNATERDTAHTAHTAHSAHSRLCHRCRMSHVDAAGAEEQCAEAGAKEPVPEEQEGAFACQRRRRHQRQPADPPTQTGARRLRVSLHHTSRGRSLSSPRKPTVVRSYGLC